jgi:ribosome-binding ATPase YchF (GTP1/OBG family)
LISRPNVGKSTLTNQLAGAAHAEAANFPFCTIDPNVVQCRVPDQKFKYLADTWKPPSIIPAVLKVTDIAGLIRGASEGAGLGNAFLSHIAAVDGIYHLIRAFDSDEVIHVDDSVDPIRDLETIQGELCAKDRETLEKVLDREKDRVRKEKGLSRAADVPLGDAFQEAYDKCKKLVDANTPVQTYEDFNAAEVEIIRDWGLSTFLDCCGACLPTYFMRTIVLTFRFTQSPPSPSFTSSTFLKRTLSVKVANGFQR